MKLLTSGTIAKELNVDRDAVSYAVRKLRIKPVGVAGNVRLFSEEVVKAVENFLEHKMDSTGKVKRL